MCFWIVLVDNPNQHWGRFLDSASVMADWGKVRSNYVDHTSQTSWESIYRRLEKIVKLMTEPRIQNIILNLVVNTGSPLHIHSNNRQDSPTALNMFYELGESSWAHSLWGSMETHTFFEIGLFLLSGHISFCSCNWCESSDWTADSKSFNRCWNPPGMPFITDSVHNLYRKKHGAGWSWNISSFFT